MTKRKSTTDQWVHQVNNLAREIDAWAASTHPSAWAETLSDLHQQYRMLAAAQTFDPPEQPTLPGFGPQQKERRQTNQIESYHHFCPETCLVSDCPMPRCENIIVGAVKNDGTYTGWTLVDENGNPRGQTLTLVHSATNPRGFH